MTRSAHVLVVDDDADCRQILTLLLEAEGYSVIAAADGSLAREALASARSVELIVLDLSMPVMDGRHFLAQKRSGAHRTTPVIVFSSSPATGLEAMPDVIGVVSKDAGVDALLAALQPRQTGGLFRRPLEDSMSEPDHGRARTDQSLRAERGKTDRELEQRREAIEQSADAVVVRARSAADEVLQAARDKADDLGEAPCTPALVEERSLADDALESERSGADDVVCRERADRKRALASLLRLEREETDQHLLTERGRSDEALGARDMFLAMVSHDLRTMLGGIAMTADLLARDGAASGTQWVSRTETIQRLTARMNRLIGDLVDIASIEAGKLQVVLAKGDLRAVVRESVELFQGSAAAHSLQLTAQLDGPPLLALFDRDRILQVLANLLGNAIKFCAPGAGIVVRAEASDREVRISVADTGPGIPAENLEIIFGRFWQAGRRDRRGLGLGLYISRHILEAHGGRIWAESPGAAGSTLIFALPAA